MSCEREGTHFSTLLQTPAQCHVANPDSGECDSNTRYIKPSAPFPYPGTPQWFNLSETLSSHMVLQRAPASAKLWGWGIPGTTIRVTGGSVSALASFRNVFILLFLFLLKSQSRTNISTQRKSLFLLYIAIQVSLEATVDHTSSWNVVIPPQNAGLAFGSGQIVFETTFGNASKNLKIVLTDVSFGEVWLCTGQSNMELPLIAVGAGPSGTEPLTSWSGDVSYGTAEIANASAYPNIRVVKQYLVSIPEPTEHASTRGGWLKPDSTNIAEFSAVCWMFGRRLQAKLGMSNPIYYLFCS